MKEEKEEATCGMQQEKSGAPPLARFKQHLPAPTPPLPRLSLSSSHRATGCAAKGSASQRLDRKGRCERTQSMHRFPFV